MRKRISATVTHDNFDDLKNVVLAGNADFLIPTAYRCTVIKGKHIKSWAKSGYELIKKDADGHGFRMMSGKSSVYVFAGQLIAQNE
jgi:hypothetical protein